jgi:YD repeat-containing protein
MLIKRHDSRRCCTEQRVIVRFNTSWVQGSNWPIHRRYEYDAAGDLTATIDEHRGTARYEYDQAGRLTTAHAADGFVEHFAYDPAGNVTSAARGASGPPVACQYGPGNRLIERGGTRYAYDGAGRLVRKVHRGEETCYTWNSQGLLAGVTLPGGAKWTYHYDAFGRRVRKCGPAQAVQFIWDGDVVLHELRSDGAGEVQVIDWEFDPVGRAAMALRAADYIGKPRTAELERELVQQLLAQPEEQRYQFTQELLPLEFRLALKLASACLRQRTYFEALLELGLRTADASTIRWWLRPLVTRLGMRRVARMLADKLATHPAGVKKALYWLPSLLRGDDAKGAAALRELADKARAAELRTRSP